MKLLALILIALPGCSTVRVTANYQCLVWSAGASVEIEK